MGGGGVGGGGGGGGWGGGCVGGGGGGGVTPNDRLQPFNDWNSISGVDLAVNPHD